jgi:hypothetical protein
MPLTGILVAVLLNEEGTESFAEVHEDMSTTAIRSWLRLFFMPQNYSSPERAVVSPFLKGLSG